MGYPFKERTEGVYEEDADVMDMLGGSSRPFLFFSWEAPAHGKGALFLSPCSCGRTFAVWALFELLKPVQGKAVHVFPQAERSEDWVLTWAVEN